MPKILIVGGTFDDNGGKASGLISKLAEAFKGADRTITVWNGGKFDSLNEILDSATQYNYVFWFANVDNSKEKIRDVKAVAPHCLLVTSKRNDFVGDKKKYDLEELLQRALAIKANLCFEFCKVEDKVFNIRIFDPLGCVWYDGTDLKKATNAAVRRLDYLASVTRKASVNEDDVPAFEFNDADKKFLGIIKSSAETFHKLMCLPPDVKRFVGNASLRFKTPTRCMNGFPAIRKEDYVLISRRNVDKTGISEKDFVICHLDDDGNTVYGGMNKPSVDSPVQLRLFKALPNIDYILHGHVYVKNAPITDRAIPCGAVEEVGAVLAAIERQYDMRNAYDKDFYAINLKGHGCLIMANADTLDRMGTAEFYTRPLPEIMN